MAKKSNNTTNTTASTSTAEVTKSKADHIREYVAGNPGKTTKEIVAALKAQGVEVSTGQVNHTINAKPKQAKIDPSMVKAAAVLVKSDENLMIEEWAAMVEQVGKFVEECGGQEEALVALATYKELRLAVA